MRLNCKLLDQLTFYGSYHANKWNQLIHFVFVPLIVWTALVWLSYTPEALPSTFHDHLTFLPEQLQRVTVFNGAFLLVLGYSIFYIFLDLFAGLSWALLVGLPLWLSAVAFRQQVPDAWLWAIPIHVFSWYMQIHPGHAVLEKRKPALLDSLVQAFALAPLFVWFELLFLLGYRPQLHQQLQARIREELAKLAASRSADQDSSAKEPLLADGKGRQEVPAQS